MLTILLLLAQDGSVSGSISPAAPVRLVLKKFQMDEAKKENVAGEVLLKEGGAFSFEKVPPGKYDLLIRPEKGFVGSRWEVTVHAGMETGGIQYRLTPSDAKAMVDELLVQVRPGTDVEALAASLGCKVQNLRRGDWVQINLPDDQTVDAMIAAFKAKPGVLDAGPNGITRIR
jgi:hypothetical protein